MKIKSIIFDMDGVLWKDNHPLTSLKNMVKQLNQSGIKFAFATNNSTKSPDQYQKKLKNFEVDILQEQIITSGTTLAALMSKKFPSGGPVYIVGEEGLVRILNSYGFFHQEKNVLAVAGGLDRTINYEKLRSASLCVQSGADFYFTNIDPTFPSPEGNIPGAGSILAALEAASGKKAIVPGKPQPYMFNDALNWLNTKPDETLVIGDRLDTDILGGLNANCKTALVLSGVTNRNDLLSNSIQPHYIFEDIDSLLESFEAKGWEL